MKLFFTALLILLFGRAAQGRLIPASTHDAERSIAADGNFESNTKTENTAMAIVKASGHNHQALKRVKQGRRFARRLPLGANIVTNLADVKGLIRATIADYFGLSTPQNQVIKHYVDQKRAVNTKPQSMEPNVQETYDTYGIPAKPTDITFNPSTGIELLSVYYWFSDHRINVLFLDNQSLKDADLQQIIKIQIMDRKALAFYFKAHLMERTLRFLRKYEQILFNVKQLEDPIKAIFGTQGTSEPRKNDNQCGMLSSSYVVKPSQPAKIPSTDPNADAIAKNLKTDTRVSTIAFELSQILGTTGIEKSQKTSKYEEALATHSKSIQAETQTDEVVIKERVLKNTETIRGGSNGGIKRSLTDQMAEMKPRFESASWGKINVQNENQAAAQDMKTLFRRHQVISNGTQLIDDHQKGGFAGGTRQLDGVHPESPPPERRLIECTQYAMFEATPYTKSPFQPAFLQPSTTDAPSGTGARSELRFTVRVAFTEVPNYDINVIVMNYHANKANTSKPHAVFIALQSKFFSQTALITTVTLNIVVKAIEKMVQRAKRALFFTLEYLEDRRGDTELWEFEATNFQNFANESLKVFGIDSYKVSLTVSEEKNASLKLTTNLNLPSGNIITHRYYPKFSMYNLQEFFKTYVEYLREVAWHHIFKMENLASELITDPSRSMAFRAIDFDAPFTDDNALPITKIDNTIYYQANFLPLVQFIKDKEPSVVHYSYVFQTDRVQSDTTFGYFKWVKVEDKSWRSTIGPVLELLAPKSNRRVLV